MMIPSSDDRIDEIAQQLCDAVNGESRLIASGMVGFAVHQAESLGYEGSDVGSRMRIHCWSLYNQIVAD